MYNLLDNLFARLSEFGRAHQFQSVKLDNVFFLRKLFHFGSGDHWSSL